MELIEQLYSWNDDAFCTWRREAVLSDDALWQDLCHSKFKMSRHAHLEREGMTWRALYK